MTRHMTKKEAEDDMVQGFSDGYDPNAPEPTGNRSHSYRHGFANGRRDKGMLRDGKAAHELRCLAQACILLDTGQLISIEEAKDLGITKLRKPNWLGNDHIEIQIAADAGIPLLGPWVLLHSSSNTIVGYDNPHKLLILKFVVDAAIYQPYLDDSLPK